MSTTALPTDIDGVIERLEAIIEDCIARQDRLGYFAALYCDVKCVVGRACETPRQGAP
jgi:hypothetical protein